MVTEDYVSFETAKLLKEKGFDGECGEVFYNDGKHTRKGDFACNFICAAPSLQMAMKWLREVHRKFICVDEHYYVKDKLSHIADGFSYSFEVKHINSIYKQDGFTSYEEVCEAAIKYCLENLI